MKTFSFLRSVCGLKPDRKIRGGTGQRQLRASFYDVSFAAQAEGGAAFRKPSGTAGSENPEKEIQQK